MLPDEGEDWSTLDVGKFAFYGGIATLLVDTVIYPLELLKTKLQVDAKVGVSCGSVPCWMREYPC